MLTVLKDAARRLRRWQVAILDHSYAFALVGRWSGRRDGQIQSNKGMARKRSALLDPWSRRVPYVPLPRLGCSPLSRVTPSISPGVTLQALVPDLTQVRRVALIIPTNDRHELSTEERV